MDIEPHSPTSHRDLHTSAASRPSAPPVRTAQIPNDLTHLLRWVVWRFVWARNRWAKVPFDPRTGARADPADPATWAPFDVAVAAYRGGPWDGVGFVFAAGDGFVGVDLDDCVDPATHRPTETARETVAAFATYAEFSPSGTGVKLFGAATIPGERRRKGGVEMYAAGRFFTVTGHRLPGAPSTVAPCQDALDTLYHDTFAAPARAARPKRARPEPAPAPADRPATPRTPAEAAILRRARGARNGAKFRRLWAGDWTGYPSPSEADLALVEFLLFWGATEVQADRLFRQSALCDEKWDRDDYRARTIGKARAALARHVWKSAGKEGGR